MTIRIYLLLIIIIGLNSCDRYTAKDKFDKVIYDTYYWKYHGMIVKKYFVEKDHNRHIIIVENNSGQERIDFTFQSLRLFDFLKVGDSILKERESIDVNIKRKKLDTIIQLDFGNLKGSETYSLENPYFGINDSVALKK